MRIPRVLSVLAATMIVAGTAIGGVPRQARAAIPSYGFMMNWFPEPEEGGYYEAVRSGLYRKAGIDLSVEQFGYSVNSEQYVVSGRAAFGMANADQVLLWNAQGARLLAIMTTFQTNPIGVLWHAEDKTIHSLADLSNHTLIYTFGSPYEQYLVLKYHYKNFSTKNNDFTSRAFAADPSAVHQCFVTSEPHLYAKQGLKVKYALIASSGYNPYGSVIFTTQQFAASHPDAVRAFVSASVAGWHAYLAKPQATNVSMRSAPGAKNYPETVDEQDYSFQQMQSLGLIGGGDAATHGIGWQNPVRWMTLQRQMAQVGLKVGSVNAGQAFTDSFLPSSAG
jgi:NitT/TauT family transport system substrate-binding protein